MLYTVQVFVHPVVPVLNETRAIVRAFNKQLEAAVLLRATTVSNLRWLPFFSSLLSDDAAAV